MRVETSSDLRLSDLVKVVAWRLGLSHRKAEQRIKDVWALEPGKVYDPADKEELWADALVELFDGIHPSRQQT